MGLFEEDFLPASKASFLPAAFRMTGKKRGTIGKRILPALFLLSLIGMIAGCEAPNRYAQVQGGDSYTVLGRTIKPRGNYLQAEVITNYSEAQYFGNKSYLSARTREIFDCRNNTIKIIGRTTYAGRNATGHTISRQSFDERGARFHDPGSNYREQVIRKVCRGR